jgi:hypothetical protein
MSQARGQRTGSRGKGQRDSRQPSKSTPHRQNKPYAKGPPAKDPAQTASILKTRSFKLLVDAVGAENIALGLDSNLTRVAELVNGERFTPETAFHMEMTLGLPDGFFDHANPVLTPETIARLKSPLDYIQANADPDPVFETVGNPVVVVQTIAQTSPNNGLLEEAQMPKKTSSGSAPAAAKKSIPATAKGTAPGAGKAPPAKSKISQKPASQQSLALNHAQTVLDIRRANLHVLTARNGAKAQLGRLLEISQSNMAHRLHGQKRMDDAESNRFTERLGLPTGWLDVPRLVTDIPESVSDLLVPALRRYASGQRELPPAVEPKTKATKTPASTKVQTAGARHAPPPDADNTSVPTSVAAETNAIMGQQDQALPSAVEPAIRQPGDNDGSFFADRQPFAPTSVGRVGTEPRHLASATSLDHLQGIEPIAEALIKTLAGKARTGHLDEVKALELLRQAVLL